MKKLILFFAIVCLALFGQGIKHLNAQVVMKNSAGETTEITAEAPLLAENGEPIVWITRDYQNNRAVINIDCNQSMLSNDYNNLTTFYRDNLGDVFALHYSGEPEVWSWEWRLDDYTLLADDPSTTYTTSGSLTGNVSYGQNSTYGSGVQYTYAGYFTLADPYGGGDTQFDVVIQTVDLSLGGMDIFIEGSNVTINGVGSDVTNASGNAAFNDLTNGSYSYSVESTGYPDVEGEFTISNEDVFIQIDYAPEQTYEAYFTLTEVGTSNTVANASVSVTGIGTQTTNASGQTSFSNLDNGTYSYNISATGFEDNSGQFTINDWGATLPIALTPITPSYYNAYFSILDENTSDAIENASITIDGIGTETSNASGQATFNDLEDGTYNYTVTADGYELYSSDFTINAGDEAINVNLTPETLYYDANFSILDENTSDAIENASITIDGIGTETSNASGQATFNDLEDGTYNYTVTADEYELYSSDFTINGSDEEINVSLTPSGVGINDNNLSAVQISPNPAQTQLHIKTNGLTENVVFSIYDVSGKLVKSYQLNSMSNDIDISSFENGMYLYSITNEASEIDTGKFVKH